MSSVCHCQDDDSVKKEDDVRRRSYNEPTLEDKFDKTQMPKPMQVRLVRTSFGLPCVERMLVFGSAVHDYRTASICVNTYTGLPS